MFLLDYQKPGHATDSTAEIYSFFLGRTEVPAPLQLLSASPELLRLQFSNILYFKDHERLNFPLLSAIRFLASQEVCFDHCRVLNSAWLAKAGFSDEDMDNLIRGAEVEAFTEAENALLGAVRKVLARKRLDESEVQGLREHGWRDSDILDACAQGTSLIGMSLLFEAFSRK